MTAGYDPRHAIPKAGPSSERHEERPSHDFRLGDVRLGEFRLFHRDRRSRTPCVLRIGGRGRRRMAGTVRRDPVGPGRGAGHTSAVPGDAGVRGDRRLLCVEAPVPESLRLWRSVVHHGARPGDHRKRALHPRRLHARPGRVRRRKRVLRRVPPRHQHSRHDRQGEFTRFRHRLHRWRAVPPDRDPGHPVRPGRRSRRSSRDCRHRTVVGRIRHVCVLTAR